MPREIAPRFDPHEVERRVYDFWLAGGYFHSAPDPDKPPYCIVIPPPNVTSVLHMGHAFDNTCQDIFIRYFRARGHETLWMPGTDHAGIATQNVIERQLREEGLTRHDIGRERFLERAWAWREHYGHRIIDQLKRLGCSCDWEREVFTMDERRVRAVTEVFVRLYEKGLIYRGHYVVNWCPRCHTALSDEEAIPHERQGQLWHIRYPIKDSDEYVVVATTRPETMLGDTAVAINPNDTRYEKLLGRTVMLPLLDRELRVVLDDFVDMEFGTGVVKVTPAHDPNDFEIGQRHGLEQVIVMDGAGVINENGGRYQGMDRFEAREAIVGDLEELGLIEKVEPHTHAVPHCQRCNTILEPYLSRQWFVKIKPLAEPAHRAALDGRVRFHPERFTNNYLRWMENIRDWCISRQLWWGHRIPVFYCESCAEMMVRREPPDACTACGSKNLRQDEDVVDTWFSSWLWPFSTMGWPEETPELDYYYPTDTLVTAPDIIFFWVARMIMAGLEFAGDVPFRDVYLHGLIRDAQGRKMSKSLGNGIDPLDLVDEFGADATRFSIIMLSAEGQDINLAPEMIEQGRNFCNKLWNAYRLVEMQLPDDFAREATPWTALPRTDPADRWILSRCAHAARGVGRAIEEFHLHEALDTVYHFFWSDFCDWYLEMAKVRWYGEDPAQQRHAQLVAYNVLRAVVVMLHPFVPFIAEEVWQTLGANATTPAIIEPWPWPPEELIDDALEAEQRLVQGIISTVRNVRSEYNVKPGVEVDVVIKAPEARLDRLHAAAGTMQRLARIAGLTIAPAPEVPKPAASAFVEDVEVFLPLAGVIDLDTERERLRKDLAKAERDLAGATKKLENPSFVEKAPDHVVEHARARRAELQALAEKLRRSLAELA